MTLQIGRFTPYENLAPRVRAATPAVHALMPAQRLTTGDVAANGTIVGAVPPAPTPEARELVDRAAQRVEDLHAQNRELHFSRDQDTNRVIIQVRDLDGKVIKTIPPSKAMHIMAGGEL